jgi:hypothetical protein
VPGLVKYGDGVGLADSNKAVISTSIDIYDENGYLVGFALSIDRTDARTVTRMRHLSSQDAGRTIEQAAQPENVDITIGGYSLYNAPGVSDVPHFSLAGRVSKGTGEDRFSAAYIFKSINSQRIPFNLKVVETHPATGAEGVIYYMGCMLTRWSKPTNLNNLWVVETANIQASWVDIPASASPQIDIGKVIAP